MPVVLSVGFSSFLGLSSVSFQVHGFVDVRQILLLPREKRLCNVDISAVYRLI